MALFNEYCIELNILLENKYVSVDLHTLFKACPSNLIVNIIQSL